MPVYKMKPTPNGDGGLQLVNELPEVGNPGLLYKTPDGKIWSCTNTTTEEVTTSTWTEVGSGAGGDSELIFGYEIADLDGKHVSVDKLIALLQKYNVPGTGYTYLNIGSRTNPSSSPYALMDIGDQSGLAFELINTQYGYTGVTYSTYDFYTILQENKTDIENLIIGKDYTAGGVSPYVGVAYVYLPLIVAYNSNGPQVHFKVTKQEILDLFVD